MNKIYFKVKQIQYQEVIKNYFQRFLNAEKDSFTLIIYSDFTNELFEMTKKYLDGVADLRNGLKDKGKMT